MIITSWRDSLDSHSFPSWWFDEVVRSTARLLYTTFTAPIGYKVKFFCVLISQMSSTLLTRL